MMLRRAMAALLLAVAAAAALPAWAQAGANHEVRRGDTLFGIARLYKYERVSRNQMILAIWRANQSAFPGGDINLLEIGTVLVIPERSAIAAIDPAEADRQVRELLARPVTPPPVAAPRPPAPGKGSAGVPPGLESAASRYREGLALERKGDEGGAFKAFLEAGEAGYGVAQRKLGQIYDKGNSAVKRDYQKSLEWYAKARAQGIEIDKPLPRITPVTN